MVLVDGAALRIAWSPSPRPRDVSVTTIEGLSRDRSTRCSRRWSPSRPIQCGFCTPASPSPPRAAERNADPSEEDIKQAIVNLFVRGSTRGWCGAIQRAGRVAPAPSGSRRAGTGHRSADAAAAVPAMREP